jgi:hypothetical protein
MIDTLFDMFAFFATFFVGVFFLLLGLFGIVVGADYLDCKGFHRGTGIETRWEWGCYAKVNGQWVPKKYAFGDAHELRVK